MTLRTARPDDVEALVRVLAACNDQLEARGDLTAEHASWRRAHRLLPEVVGLHVTAQTWLVAEVGGQVVGLAAVDGEELARLYVEPALQGRGHGTALVRAAEAHVSDAGGQRVFLGAHPGAVAFYERLDYRVVGRRRGPGGDAVILEKVLDWSGFMGC